MLVSSFSVRCRVYLLINFKNSIKQNKIISYHCSGCYTILKYWLFVRTTCDCGDYLLFIYLFRNLMTCCSVIFSLLALASVAEPSENLLHTGNGLMVCQESQSSSDCAAPPLQAPTRSQETRQALRVSIF